MSQRLSKGISVFLGILMFLFGILKFFQPFRGMFAVQIQQSHLPATAELAGKVGEMVTGVLFLAPWFVKTLNVRRRDQLQLLACLILLTQMAVAIYVHLQPQVPASALPLGIKPPFIPGFVLLLGVFTAVAAWKELRAA